jgi:predicted oxidoreductase
MTPLYAQVCAPLLPGNSSIFLTSRKVACNTLPQESTMSTLSYYTQRLGGKFAPYSQAAQIARKGLASRQGICTSCSLTYLAMDRSRLKFGEEKDKQTTMAFIDSGQNLYESPLQTPSSIPNLSAQAENLITGASCKIKTRGTFFVSRRAAPGLK